jgi:hypothetical protein
MQLVPAPAQQGSVQIAPRERNVGFTVDFGPDIPAGSHAHSAVATATELATGTDVSDTFIGAQVLTGSIVTLALGNGQQTEGTVYRVRVVLTLDNTPSTALAGYFDLPCYE